MCGGNVAEVIFISGRRVGRIGSARRREQSGSGYHWRRVENALMEAGLGVAWPRLGVAMRTGDGVGANGDGMSEGDKPRRWKRWRVARWLLGIIVVLGLMGPLGYRAYYRARCGAAMTVSISFLMRSSRSLSVEASNPTGELRSIGVQLVEGVFRDDIFRGFCYSDSLTDVIIGGYSLQKLRIHPVPIDELESSVQVDIQTKGWEQLGRFHISYENQAYKSLDPTIIIGLSCYETSGHALLCFANTMTNFVSSSSELLKFIDSDRSARLNLGLDPPLDIEKEIADYRARKNLKPLRD